MIAMHSVTCVTPSNITLTKGSSDDSLTEEGEGDDDDEEDDDVTDANKVFEPVGFAVLEGVISRLMVSFSITTTVGM